VAKQISEVNELWKLKDCNRWMTLNEINKYDVGGLIKQFENVTGNYS
jgi:hypothetical protein